MTYLSLLINDEEKVTFANVQRKVTNTLYIVKDNRNREFTVESGKSYRKGQSVSVKSGVIIGPAKSPKTVKHFNV